MSKLKENLFQVAVDDMHAKQAMALVISNRDSLLALTNYNEDRKKAERLYAEALDNKEVSWSKAKGILTTMITNAKWKRDIKEEEVFRAYIKALDDAELAFAKESKALDSFVTYDDEISIEGE